MKATILGVKFNTESPDELVKLLAEDVQAGRKKQIVTPNPEHLITAWRNPSFFKVLNQAEYAIPDGGALIWASRFLKISPVLRKRITGVDFMLRLCQEASQRGWSAYLLGGRPGVAKAVAQKLCQRYPDLIMAGYSSASPEEFDHPVRRPPIPVCQLLFVAYGAPKQEFFIAGHLDKLPVNIAMGVGGGFDLLSGRVPRAPIFWRRHGPLPGQEYSLEWLWRLLREPWRLSRQLRLLLFLILIFRARLSKGQAFV